MYSKESKAAYVLMSDRLLRYHICILGDRFLEVKNKNLITPSSAWEPEGIYGVRVRIGICKMLLCRHGAQNLHRFSCNSITDADVFHRGGATDVKEPALFCMLVLFLFLVLSPHPFSQKSLSSTAFFFAPSPSYQL